MTAPAANHNRPIYQSIDSDRLSAWLSESIAGFAGPLSLKWFDGGQSNPTFLMTTAGGHYVLRRQPLGPS